MAVLLSPNDIDNRRPHLEHHPTIWIWIEGSQCLQRGAEVLRDRNYSPIEQGNALAEAKVLPVPQGRIADLFRDVLIDLEFCHRQPSHHYRKGPVRTAPLSYCLGEGSLPRLLRNCGLVTIASTRLPNR